MRNHKNECNNPAWMSKSYTTLSTPPGHNEMQVCLYRARGKLEAANIDLREAKDYGKHLSEATLEGFEGVAIAIRDLQRRITDLSEWAEKDID